MWTKPCVGRAVLSLSSYTALCGSIFKKRQNVKEGQNVTISQKNGPLSHWDENVTAMSDKKCKDMSQTLG
jgi:hypothetical protein